MILSYSYACIRRDLAFAACHFLPPVLEEVPVLPFTVLEEEAAFLLLPEEATFFRLPAVFLLPAVLPEPDLLPVLEEVLPLSDVALE